MPAWSGRSENIAGGVRIGVLANDAALSFRDVFRLLEEDESFAGWYTDLLVDSRFAALFWEHPPVTPATIDRPYESVLLDAPSLDGLRADPAPFRDRFRQPAPDGIVAFDSLGGDALLIAPCPLEPLSACAHLAAFLRQAPADAVRALWRQTARTLRQGLASGRPWLSTSGLGVAWLHIRFDSVPKYYQHAPYRRAL